MNFAPGGRWDESSVGTNALALALDEDREAEGELLQEAAVGGILGTARDNARATVATLLQGLGFEKIDVD